VRAVAVVILGGLKVRDDEALVVKLWKMEKGHLQQQPSQPLGFVIIRDCRRP
jgi:hypothetical protein